MSSQEMALSFKQRNTSKGSVTSNWKGKKKIVGFRKHLLNDVKRQSMNDFFADQYMEIDRLIEISIFIVNSD